MEERECGPTLFAFFVFLCGNSISAFGFSVSVDSSISSRRDADCATGTVALPVSFVGNLNLQRLDAHWDHEPDGKPTLGARPVPVAVFGVPPNT